MSSQARLRFALVEQQRRQRRLGDVAGDRLDARVELVTRDHLVHQSDLQRPLGVDDLGMYR